MKRVWVLMVLQLGFIVAYGQQGKKQAAVSPIASVLSAEQQIKVRAVNKQFSEEMKTFLQQPVGNPMERRAKIEQMRLQRDSTLKVLLGEQTFTTYREKTNFTKKKK